MAYSRRRRAVRRSTGRSSRRSSGYSRSAYAPRRRVSRTSRTRSPRGQTIRIVFETANPNLASGSSPGVPGLLGVARNPVKPKKSTF